MTTNKSIEPKLVKISEELQVGYGSLFGKSRKHYFVRIRYCVWYYLNKILEYEHKEIASLFNKDHSTIGYGIRQAGFRKENYNDYKTIYRTIKRIFEAL